MVKAVGLVMAVQGGGGLINNVADGGKSWFVLNHLGLPTSLTLLGHVLLLVAGLALLGRGGVPAWLKGGD